jgi:hypothetical protein
MARLVLQRGVEAMDPRATEILDWREQLLRAIAYRMVELWGIEADEAREQVRDVMHHGYNSQHLKLVGEAAMDMFRPVFGAVLPILPGLASAVMQAVQQQNVRGAEAEERLQAL